MYNQEKTFVKQRLKNIYKNWIFQTYREHSEIMFHKPNGNVRKTFWEHILISWDTDVTKYNKNDTLSANTWLTQRRLFILNEFCIRSVHTHTHWPASVWIEPHMTLKPHPYQHKSTASDKMARRLVQCHFERWTGLSIVSLRAKYGFIEFSPATTLHDSMRNTCTEQQVSWKHNGHKEGSKLLKQMCGLPTIAF